MVSHMDRGFMYFELEFCKCAKKNALGCVFCVIVGINKYYSKLIFFMFFRPCIIV